MEIGFGECLSVISGEIRLSIFEFLTRYHCFLSIYCLQPLKTEDIIYPFHILSICVLGLMSSYLKILVLTYLYGVFFFKFFLAAAFNTKATNWSQIVFDFQEINAKCKPLEWCLVDTPCLNKRHSCSCWPLLYSLGPKMLGLFRYLCRSLNSYISQFIIFCIILKTSYYRSNREQSNKIQIAYFWRFILEDIRV